MCPRQLHEHFYGLSIIDKVIVKDNPNMAVESFGIGFPFNGIRLNYISLLTIDYCDSERWLLLERVRD